MLEELDKHLLRLLTLVSNCTIWGEKKLRFIKYQETSTLELH